MFEVWTVTRKRVRMTDFMLELSTPDTPPGEALYTLELRSYIPLIAEVIRAYPAFNPRAFSTGKAPPHCVFHGRGDVVSDWWV